MTLNRLKMKLGAASLSLVVFALAAATVGSAGLAAGANKIYFVASNTAIPQEWIDSFYVGVEAAFIEHYGLNVTRQYLEKRVDYSKDPLVIRRLAETSIKDGAAALIGFPTSHESLLIADLCKKYDVMCLSVGMATEKAEQQGDTLYTIKRSTPDGIRQITEYISRKFPGKKGAIIVHPQTVFSKEITGLIERSSAKIPGMKWTKIMLDTNAKMSPDDVKSLATYDYLYLTVFPWEAESVLADIASQDFRGRLFATDSWDGWDVTSFVMLKPSLTKLKTSIVFPGLWRPGSKNSSHFEELVHKNYNVSPPTAMALGYDAGQLMTEVFKDKVGKMARPDVMKAVRTTKICAEQTSSGKMCLPKGGGFAERDVYFSELNGTGFHPFSLD